MFEPRPESIGDLLNIQGQDIPDIDKELEALLVLGRDEPVMILSGASRAVFGDQAPYAQTTVSVTFDDEADLRRCVRLLRWSDERLLELGSTICWSWDVTVRDGMTIRFAVNWFDADFFAERGSAFLDDNHVSYFGMFGKTAQGMSIATEILDDSGNRPRTPTL